MGPPADGRRPSRSTAGRSTEPRAGSCHGTYRHSVVAPPGTPRLASGCLLTGRYRLLAELSGDRSDRVWHAQDELLGREVALRVCVLADEVDRQRFLAAAAMAGRAHAPALARTFDAGQATVDGATVTYHVEEWVGGATLADLLGEGPLPPAAAVRLACEVAEAAEALLAIGGQHHNIHPGTVRLAHAGEAKLCGGGVARLGFLAGGPGSQPEIRPPAAESTLPPPAGRTGGRAPATPEGSAGMGDAAGVAALLYACLTARWPGPEQHRGSLPRAPRPDGVHPARVRDVQAGVPRSLESLLDDVLRAPVEVQASSQTLTQLRRGLAAAIATDPALRTPGAVFEPPRPAAPGAAQPRRGPRRWLPAAGAGLAALLLGAGVAFVVTASRTAPAASLPVYPSAAAAPSPGRSASLPPWSVTRAISFDPMGNGTERQSLAPLAFDGNPATSWLTDIYTTAEFGNLKNGVGLVFDLGTPRTVRQVRLEFPLAGLRVEVLAAGSTGDGGRMPGSLAGFRTVAAPETAGRFLVRPLHIRARFWLVWFTRLAPTQGGYIGGISGAQFLR